MASLSYSDLALDWSIQSRSDRRFKAIITVVVIALLSFGLFLSSINLPAEKREARRQVPPRIANFLIEKKKAEPKVEKPKPKPVKPKPKPKPKPKVKKIKEKPEDKKPLTKIEKKAREKAAESGLLALSNELADLMDTDDLTGMVGGAVKSGEFKSTNRQKSQELLLADATTGSGGVGNDQLATVVGKTVASKREISAVKQSLISEETLAKNNKKDAKNKKRTGSVRSEESITLIFDRNKSVLFSLYNRARRKDPGLKGKIILELTIEPAGNVTAIKIVSSELGNKSLESRILKRIKLFKFGAQNVKRVTVTYPIDFLPS